MGEVVTMSEVTPMTTPTVGQDLDAWCNKCKLELAHVVVSLNATGRPHRVECKTCRDVHAYRLEAPTPGRAQSSSTPRKTDYERGLRDRDLSEAVPYDTRRTYAVDDLIRHKTLGVGLVTASRADQKIEVLFPDGPKLLICGR
jgi:hypothetical protein